MAAFKHHKYFPKEKDAQRFLFPHVCFDCRKSFKKPASDEPRLCPQCSNPLAKLSRKFSAPASSDKAQWEKVHFLVEHGFLFQSVFEPSESGGQQRVPYPSTLEEARKFVVEFQAQAAGNAT
ncbi:MAG: hypothetical protein CVU22_12365 [Betaproteobacteria bacterium HGW-Betaproteobacteria-16]|nr:MAG: hypothetical protein CVU22_12365 [Betaproteobacteria bacterium HGW-Betaproteobacteria-16]